MTTPNFRALCAELLNWIERASQAHVYGTQDLITRASAALAEPVGEGPTDEELTMTYAYAVAAAVDNKRGPFNKEDAEAAQLAGLRAVLARWAHPATPPAPEVGEVAELAAYLRNPDRWTQLTDAELDRAAVLLVQQQHLLGLACQELDNLMEQQQAAPAPAVLPAAQATPLSPAAQAVLDAVASQMEGGWISPDFIPYEAKKIAAALRAVGAMTTPPTKKNSHD